MGTERKGRTEIMVGLFLFIGLAILGMLVITFGRLGGALKTPYELTVLFPNATGLAPGADVLLSGAKIGMLASSPQLVGDSYRVAVKINVQGDVHIPKNSKFIVGSAGLLGDKYVDVIPPAKGEETGGFWEQGNTIEGSRSGGFDELAVQGGVVLEKLTESLHHVQMLASNLNERLLNENNMENLKQTFENLKDTTAAFKNSSATLDLAIHKADTAIGKADAAFSKVDGLMTKTEGVLTTANNTLETYNTVGQDLRPVISELKTTAERASKAADSVQKFTKSATEGKGPLGLLVNDKETSDNLRSFIANLKRSGVLFYKDKPLNQEENKDKGR